MIGQGGHVATQPLLDVEIRAGFALFDGCIELAMAHHLCIVVVRSGIDVGFQLGHQLFDRSPLLWGVSGFANHADADGAAVVPANMSANLIGVAAGMDCAVDVDYKVIADAG